MHLERLHHVGEYLGADGVEPEVDVEDVELVVMLLDPRRVQHQRWPPTAGHLTSVGGHGVRQSDHGI